MSLIRIVMPVLFTLGVAAAAHAADAKKTVPIDERLKLCATCHGAGGKGDKNFPDYPILAGQHADFLEKALRDYKSGKRKNAIMGAQAQELTNDEMRALARYFANQSGGPLYLLR
jgi:cytochrome c553